jgi:hypothetical protein
MCVRHILAFNSMLVLEIDRMKMACSHSSRNADCMSWRKGPRLRLARIAPHKHSQGLMRGRNDILELR